MSTNDQPGLMMRRPDLRNLPPIELPEGYAVRHYNPGDEQAWNTIIHEGFSPNYDFDKHMKGDAAFVPERVWFITKNDVPVATASAWLLSRFGPHTGLMHMVGTLSGHQGKRLGYWVSLAAMHRFLTEGRLDAMLQTNDFRLPAIKTYLNLGFEPVLIHENQRSRWHTIMQKLGCEELEKQFEDILEGPLASI
jgi:mycothiol synthase